MNTRLRRLRKRRVALTPAGARPAMSLTPLAGIGLVLLVVAISMLFIPALFRGARLASLFRGQPRAVAPAPSVLSITREHGLYLDQRPLAADALESQLRAARRAQPSRRIIVRADERVRYARLQEVLRIARRAGFAGVSLRMERRSSGGRD